MLKHQTTKNMTTPLDIAFIEIRKFEKTLKLEFDYIRYDADADTMWLTQEDDETAIIYLDPRRYAHLFAHVMDDLTDCYGYKQIEL